MATSSLSGTQFDDRPIDPLTDGSGSSLFPPDARDRSIPIRTGDLARVLLEEPGTSPDERKGLSQLIRLLGSVFHYEFYAWLTELKELYAPIDPESDCIPIEGSSRVRTEEADEAFLGPFEAALIKANYRKLELKALEQAITTPNELGLNYVPDLKLFEHLRVYVRGQAKIVREIRNLKTRFRKRTVILNAYRRVAIVLKFKPDMNLGDGDYARTDVVYLRLFRDVPFVEMDMHLPEQGTKVRMRWFDKLQIASPVVTGIPVLIAKLFLAATISPLLMGTVMIGPVSAGVKSFFGFVRTKQRYLHRMIRHLYYLTMANNSSVINRLIDSAEEEEFKEALLAYYFLWRLRDDPEPWDAPRLDEHIEAFLRQKTLLDIDFEIGDALGKLTRLGLVHRDCQDRLSAVPIDQALAILDGQWDNYFRYH